MAVLVPGAAFALSPYAELGIGLPEVLHLRVGGFVHPRASIELYAGNVVFNWLVGLGATGYFLGEARENGPPRHSLLAGAHLALNPLLTPIRFTGGGETIGSAAFVTVGYALHTDNGFTFRAYSGAILYADAGLAGGPLLSVGVGYKF